MLLLHSLFPAHAAYGYLPVVLLLTIFFRIQHFKRRSATWGKLWDGIFPLTVHADESIVYYSYLALINLTT
jgi:hypothetical protein